MPTDRFLLTIIVIYLFASGCNTSPVKRTGQSTETNPARVSTDSAVRHRKSNQSEAQSYLVERAAQQIDAQAYRDAALTLDRALALDPKNPQVYYQYARLRNDQQKYMQAKSLLNRAASLQPDKSLLEKIKTLRQQIDNATKQ